MSTGLAELANGTDWYVPGRSCHRRELRDKTGRQVKPAPVVEDFENYFKTFELPPTTPDNGKHKRF